MRTLHKLLLVPLSLAGIGLSVAALSLFYHIPFVTDAVKWYFASFFWMDYIFTGYLAAVCLCFAVVLLVALFSRNQSNELILVKGKGKLYFAKRTLESTVRYSFSDVEGINYSRVRVKIGGGSKKVKIHIKLSLKDPGKLLELTESVQNKIESALGASLGVAADSVNIQVLELAPVGNDIKENRETTENGGSVKDSRVI